MAKAEKITLYRTKNEIPYIEIGTRVYMDGRLRGSPIVGHTDEEYMHAVHRRVEGYQNYIKPGVVIGKCLVRDAPEIRPRAGVSAPILSIENIKRKNYPANIPEQTLVDLILKEMK